MDSRQPAGSSLSADFFAFPIVHVPIGFLTTFGFGVGRGRRSEISKQQKSA
jgi:hypothetical protein